MSEELRQVPLGKLGKYIRGITFTASDKLDAPEAGTVACMRTANIQGHLDDSDLIHVSSKHVKREEQYLHAGDILISASNSWNLVGKCVSVPELEYPASAGGFISIFRPDSEVVEPGFIYRWMASSQAQQMLRDCARQTTNIANLNTKQFKALAAPVPPRNVQRRFVDAAEQLDATRQRQRSALARLDALLAAVFDEMFGDPVMNQKDWPTASVPKLFKDHSSGQPRLKTSEYLDAGCVPVVDQGEAEVSGYADDRDLLADVPLPVIVFGDHTRRFKLIDFPFVVGAQGTKLLVPGDRLDPTFAYHQLRAMPLPSTGYARHYKFLKAMKLIVPPLAEQVRFAEVVRQSDPLRQRLTAQGARLDALYAALAARAFRGDLALT